MATVKEALLKLEAHLNVNALYPEWKPSKISSKL